MGQDKFIIILLGPPGVGKGTQGQRLASEFGFHYAATGDLLRDAVNRGTPLGMKAKEIMQRGELVSDEIMNGIAEEVLKSSNLPIIFDGYPRTVAQAEQLDKTVRPLGRYLKRVVLLKADDDELTFRLSARRVCISCQAIYNLNVNPPKDDERCDRCGSTVIQRDDDKPQVIRQRLAVYHTQTQPVIDYYRKQRLLVEVKASGTPEKVYADLKQAVKF